MTDKLNAMSSFQSGASIADAIAGRRLQQQQLGILEQDQAIKQEQEQYKRRQEQAKQQLGVLAYNDPSVMKEYMVRDPQAAKELFELRNKHNKISNDIINYVVDKNVPVEERNIRWQQALPILKQNGLDISDLPQELDQDGLRELELTKKSIKTWDDAFKTVETDQGLKTFNPSTGGFGDTPYGVYQRPPSSIVNVNNRQETEFEKAIGKIEGESIGKNIEKVRTAAEEALRVKDLLGQQKEALKNLTATGPADNVKIFAGNLVSQFGIDKTDFLRKLSKDANNLQVIEAAANQIGIPMVKQLGYNPTDADYKAIMSMIGNIGKGKATIQDLISALDKLSDKSIAKADYVDMLVEEGKYKQIPKLSREWDKENPIDFSKEVIEENTQDTLYQEGTTATNPQTGEKMIFREGLWQKM